MVQRAKVKVEFNRKGITKRIKTLVGRELQKNKVQDLALVELQKEIRSGMLPDGRVNPSLATSTIRNRERIAELNETHPDYISTFSNLTLTGELIDKGIQSTFIISQFNIVLQPKKGLHKIYKTKTRRTTGRRARASYADIFAGLSAVKNRNVFSFGSSFLARLGNKIKKVLIKSIS